MGLGGAGRLALSLGMVLGAAACGDDEPGVGDPICTQCNILGTGDTDWQLDLTIDPEFDEGNISNPRVETLWTQRIPPFMPPEQASCLYAGMGSGFTTPPSQWDDVGQVQDVILRNQPAQPCPLSTMPSFDALSFRLSYETAAGSTSVALDKQF